MANVDHVHARGEGSADAKISVFEDGAGCGLHIHAFCGEEEHFRIGLAAGDVVGADDDGEEVDEADGGEGRGDDVAFAAAGHGNGHGAGEGTCEVGDGGEGFDLVEKGEVLLFLFAGDGFRVDGEGALSDEQATDFEGGHAGELIVHGGGEDVAVTGHGFGPRAGVDGHGVCKGAVAVEDDGAGCGWEQVMHVVYRQRRTRAETGGDGGDCRLTKR